MCIQLIHFSYDDRENMFFFYFIIIIKSEVWPIWHCIGLGHEAMVCAVCPFMFLWVCDMAGLLRGTSLSWWFSPRICSPVTDMRYYYLARYLTDDWHLANMFSHIYFSVVVWLRGCNQHSVSPQLRPCVSFDTPLTLVSPFLGKPKM